MYMKMSTKRPGSKTPRYSVATLRSQLARAIREAEAGETIEIVRRGEPVAVLLGRQDYARLRSRRGDFWESYSRFREKHDLTTLDLDPDEIFGDVRDPSPGRKVDL